MLKGFVAGSCGRATSLARSYATWRRGGFKRDPEHVLHCLFTRNNTVLTLSRRVHRVRPEAVDGGELDQAALIDLVRPQQEVLFTVTTGQLGFRGTKKSTYDAAYQTAAKMFDRMAERKLLDRDIELVTRNFGENRQAFFNALMGKEGTHVRPLVKRITDGTRIKFGGDRAPNRRRV